MKKWHTADTPTAGTALTQVTRTCVSSCCVSLQRVKNNDKLKAQPAVIQIIYLLAVSHMAESTAQITAFTKT